MQTRSRLLPSGPQTLAHCTFIYRSVACLYCSQLQTLLQEAKGKYSTNESVTLPLPEVHSSLSTCDSATLSFLPSESWRLRLLLDRPWAGVSPGCPPWPFPPRSRSVFWQLPPLPDGQHGLHADASRTRRTCPVPRPHGSIRRTLHTWHFPWDLHQCPLFQSMEATSQRITRVSPWSYVHPFSSLPYQLLLAAPSPHLGRCCISFVTGVTARCPVPSDPAPPSRQTSQ